MSNVINLGEYRKKKKGSRIALTKAKLLELLAKYGSWSRGKTKEKKD